MQTELQNVIGCSRVVVNVDFATNITDLASYLPGTSILAMATNFKTSPCALIYKIYDDTGCP